MGSKNGIKILLSIVFLVVALISITANAKIIGELDVLDVSGTEGSDPYSKGSLKTAAINLRASDGTVTQVELLYTPDAEINGVPVNPEILYTWTE